MARRHLDKVQEAWPKPTDWSDLALYGFYCLEAAVMAASRHVGLVTQRSHPAKLSSAERLHREHGLPDISVLLVDLNVARKSAAYGDMEFPELDAEGLADEIERYVSAVSSLMGK